MMLPTRKQATNAYAYLAGIGAPRIRPEIAILNAYAEGRLIDRESNDGPFYHYVECPCGYDSECVVCEGRGDRLVEVGEEQT